MVLHGQNTSSGAGSNPGLVGDGGRAGMGLNMENMGSTGLQKGSNLDLKIRWAKGLDLWRNQKYCEENQNDRVQVHHLQYGLLISHRLGGEDILAICLHGDLL